jgi:hypothetical protein
MTKQPTPLECLQNQLDAMIRARDNFQTNFSNGKLSEDVYDDAMNTLTPMIEMYRYNIRCLITYA